MRLQFGNQLRPGGDSAAQQEHLRIHDILHGQQCIGQSVDKANVAIPRRRIVILCLLHLRDVLKAAGQFAITLFDLDRGDILPVTDILRQRVRITHVAGQEVRAGKHLAAHADRTTEARTQHECDEILKIGRAAAPDLAQRRTVSVLFQRHGHVHHFPQLVVFPADEVSQAWRELGKHHACCRVDAAAGADADAAEGRIFLLQPVIAAGELLHEGIVVRRNGELFVVDHAGIFLHHADLDRRAAHIKAQILLHARLLMLLLCR